MNCVRCVCVFVSVLVSISHCFYYHIVSNLSYFRTTPVKNYSFHNCTAFSSGKPLKHYERFYIYTIDCNFGYSLLTFSVEKAFNVIPIHFLWCTFQKLQIKLEIKIMKTIRRSVYFDLVAHSEHKWHVYAAEMHRARKTERKRDSNGDIMCKKERGR